MKKKTGALKNLQRWINTENLCISLYVSKVLKHSLHKAKCAIARELACFIWGMMTNNIHTVLV